MKALYRGFILLLATLYGCGSSGGEEKMEDGKMDAALSPESIIAEAKAKNTPAEIALGKTIELNTCGKCHVHYPPDLHTVTEWEKILPVMTQRAGLDEQAATKLRAYLLINSKQ